MEIIPRNSSAADGGRSALEPQTAQNLDLTPRPGQGVDWTTWWPWRGACTRSHPELGREIPQRPWYCVLRHGRVGRRQVLQSTQIYPRGVEQPGSSSGS